MALATLVVGGVGASSGTTERISVASDGTQGNGTSFDSAISADGRYVAFASYASNLVPGDTNEAYAPDAFVHDRLTGATQRVSVDSAGNQASYVGFGGSRGLSISADGRWVAFSSYATNLVPGDTNNTADIFVHDRQTLMTERVSVDSAGNEGRGPSLAPAISATGRFVAFRSASRLVAGDTNNRVDVFVHDRQTGATIRVSVNSAGEQGDSGSGLPSISADGRFVAFASEASNLVASDTNTCWRRRLSCPDIFVHDRQTGVTERVSVDSAGNEATSDHRRGLGSSAPSISADGRFVAFGSDATNLVASDTNNRDDIFVHDRQTGATTRVSVDSGGNEALGYSDSPAISADGRFVAFRSMATNLVPGDTNNRPDIFVHDRLSGAMERVSVDSAGNQAIGNLYGADAASISADGRFVAFRSLSSNLVPGDTNTCSVYTTPGDCSDVFVRDRGSAAAPRSVTIDIRPGSSHNSTNLGSHGVIPVAILSGPDFDAPRDVDRASLTFGRTGDEDSLGNCSPGPRDVNGDGRKDLVCRFHTYDTEFQCGDTEGLLRGETVDGMPMEGSDSVRIVPCRWR